MQAIRQAGRQVRRHFIMGNADNHQSDKNKYENKKNTKIT